MLPSPFIFCLAIFSFFGLHVGIYVLYVVIVFKKVYHLVYRGALLRSHVFQVVGYARKLGSRNLETVFLQVFLYVSKAFRIAIYRNLSSFVINIVIVLYAVVYEVENELSREMLSGKLEDGASIYLSMKDGKVAVAYDYQFPFRDDLPLVVLSRQKDFSLDKEMFYVCRSAFRQ